MNINFCSIKRYKINFNKWEIVAQRTHKTKIRSYNQNLRAIKRKQNKLIRFGNRIGRSKTIKLKNMMLFHKRYWNKHIEKRKMAGGATLAEAGV